jgi:hypothetical protein
MTLVNCFFVGCLLIAQQAFGQERWAIGGGLTYCSYIHRPGVNLSATFKPLKHFHISPDFSAILTRREERNSIWLKRKELEGNINFAYDIALDPNFRAYALTGANIAKITIHEENHFADKQIRIGINFGCGIELDAKSHTYFFEGKYVSHLRKYDVASGLLFKL